MICSVYLGGTKKTPAQNQAEAFILFGLCQSLPPLTNNPHYPKQDQNYRSRSDHPIFPVAPTHHAASSSSCVGKDTRINPLAGLPSSPSVLSQSTSHLWVGQVSNHSKNSFLSITRPPAVLHLLRQRANANHQDQSLGILPKSWCSNDCSACAKRPCCRSCHRSTNRR